MKACILLHYMIYLLHLGKAVIFVEFVNLPVATEASSNQNLWWTQRLQSPKKSPSTEVIKTQCILKSKSEAVLLQMFVEITNSLIGNWYSVSNLCAWRRDHQAQPKPNQKSSFPRNFSKRWRSYKQNFRIRTTPAKDELPTLLV